MDEYKSMNETVEYYRKLADDISTTNDSIRMQLNWIEQGDFQVSRLSDSNGDEDQETMGDAEFYERFIKGKAVTSNEIEAHKSSNSRTYKVEFLKAHGIPKNSEEAKQCAKYLGEKGLTSALSKKVTFDGTTYTLRSCTSNQNKDRTFYLFVKD